MKYRVSDYAKILFDLTLDVKSSELQKVLKHFVFFLSRHRALRLVPQILHSFQEMRDEEEGVIRMKLMTARKIDPRLFQASLPSQKIHTEYAVDPSLIGGAMLQVSNTILDGSVRNHLNSLRHALCQ